MHCFVDADGVLGDFEGQCLTLFGKRPDEIPDDRLWKMIYKNAEKFWLEMPVLAGAHEIINLCKPYGATVLTGCPYDNEDDTQICKLATKYKTMFVERHFPGIQVIACFSSGKTFHMKEKGDMLIDDYIVNVKRWQKAGGEAIWYKSAEQAIAALKLKLESLNV